MTTATPAPTEGADRPWWSLNTGPGASQLTAAAWGLLVGALTVLGYGLATPGNWESRTTFSFTSVMLGLVAARQLRWIQGHPAVVIEWIEDRLVMLPLILFVLLGVLFLAPAIASHDRATAGATLVTFAIYVRLTGSLSEPLGDPLRSISGRIRRAALVQACSATAFGFGILMVLSQEQAVTDHVSATVPLALLISMGVAVGTLTHKTNQRIRRNCTRTAQQITKILRAFEERTRPGASPTPRVLLELVDELDLILRSSLETGYSRIGYRIVPAWYSAGIIESLHHRADPNHVPKPQPSPLMPDPMLALRGIRERCLRWVDIAA
jgi:hypothetical protein